MRSDAVTTMVRRPEQTEAIESGFPQPDPDADLLETLRGGQDQAAEALVARFGRRVYRLAVRITGNAHDAEEAAQDALWRVLTKIHTFRGESAFSSWVYRVTANSAYEARRRRHHARHEVSWDEALPRFDEQGHHAAPITDWSPLVDDPATRSELRAELRRAIEQLPDEYRAVFVMRDVEGMSNADVAETLGMSVPAVKSRLHRARLVLRERLSRSWVTRRHPGAVAAHESAQTRAVPGARVFAARVSRRPDAGASVAAAMSTAT